MGPLQLALRTAQAHLEIPRIDTGDHIALPDFGPHDYGQRYQGAPDTEGQIDLLRGAGPTREVTALQLSYVVHAQGGYGSHRCGSFGLIGAAGGQQAHGRENAQNSSGCFGTHLLFSDCILHNPSITSAS